jgi:hypothetical protein
MEIQQGITMGLIILAVAIPAIIMVIRLRK